MMEDQSEPNPDDAGSASETDGIGGSGTGGGGSGTGGGGPSGDDLLAGVRRLAGLAKDLGISDLSGVSALLEQARQEGKGGDLLRSLKSLVDQFTAPGPGAGSEKGPGPGPSLSDLGERLSWAMGSAHETTNATATKNGPIKNDATKDAATNKTGRNVGAPAAAGARDTTTTVAAAEAEQALLRRIEELSGAATIEGVVDLAGAYVQIRAAGGRGPVGPPAGSVRPT
ncbi:MAG: hypothetical protein ACRDZ8_02775 [Acidimicrobiales bacterium]